MTTGTAYLTGFGTYLPNQPVDNEQIEKVLGEVNRVSTRLKQRILINNGILTRHYAIDPETGRQTHTNVQLTAEAIRALAAKTGFNLQDLECLVCGTSSADQVIPSHGSMVHAELKIPPCEVATTSGVCCAGMTAFKYGWLNVASGACANAMVTGSDLASNSMTVRHFRPQLDLLLQETGKEPQLAFENDFLRWMLSDGAGAWLIANKPSPDRLSLKIDWFDLWSFAHESDVCMFFGMERQADGTTHGYRSVADPLQYARGRYFNLGQDANLLSERMPGLMRQALDRIKPKRNLQAERVDWFLPHYSSKWFRQTLYDILAEKGLEIPYERWFTNLPSKGNTGAASIYIILEELVSSGKIRSGDRLLCYIPESARMMFAFLHLTAV